MLFDLSKFVMKLKEIAFEYPKLNGIHSNLKEKYEHEDNSENEPMFGDIRKYDDIGFNNM